LVTDECEIVSNGECLLGEVVVLVNLCPLKWTIVRSHLDQNVRRPRLPVGCEVGRHQCIRPGNVDDEIFATGDLRQCDLTNQVGTTLPIIRTVIGYSVERLPISRMLKLGPGE